MSTIYETISVLEQHNKWRRGDETISQLDPFEVGVAIGDAVRLLRELGRLRAEVERLNLELTALGDLAVGYWDDSTVGQVDAILPHAKQITYKDQLKTLFGAHDVITRLRGRAEKAEDELKQTQSSALNWARLLEIKRSLEGVHYLDGHHRGK
jgi:hypothetical protein